MEQTRPQFEHLASVCDKCGSNAIHKQMLGVEWDKIRNRSFSFYGNSFCIDCFEEIKRDVDQYRPAPGYSKPPRFIVARHKERSSITGEAAITLAIAYGNWLKASAIAKSALTKRKRFFPGELRCEKRIYTAIPSSTTVHRTATVHRIATSIPKVKITTPTAAPGTKMTCSVCGAICLMNKTGLIRAHRNELDRKHLCMGY